MAAIKTVDRCLDQVIRATLKAGGVAIVTSDHGNAETMLDEETGQPHTAHTTNLVPFLLVGEAYRESACERGSLRDIVPDARNHGFADSQEMTGESLIVK